MLQLQMLIKSTVAEISSFAEAFIAARGGISTLNPHFILIGMR